LSPNLPAAEIEVTTDVLDAIVALGPNNPADNSYGAHALTAEARRR
jgi:hypothetical protein